MIKTTKNGGYIITNYGNVNFEVQYKGCTAISCKGFADAAKKARGLAKLYGKKETK
jgi:hypothetical protein